MKILPLDQILSTLLGRVGDNQVRMLLVLDNEGEIDTLSLTQEYPINAIYTTRANDC
jgi:hypothetical protein